MSVFRHILFAAALSAATSSVLAAAMPATVYKSPSCGCCEAYVSYLKQNGFEVTAINRDDLSGIKQQLGVTPGMGSCHTAKIGGYTVEGHVPAAAIRRLLREKPHIVGLTVPGMPQHAPGMGTPQPGTLPVYEMTPDQRSGLLFGRF